MVSESNNKNGSFVFFKVLDENPTIIFNLDANKVQH
jgi:hypothetical protein